jgi:hypothetical protein
MQSYFHLLSRSYIHLDDQEGFYLDLLLTLNEGGRIKLFLFVFKIIFACRDVCYTVPLLSINASRISLPLDGKVVPFDVCWSLLSPEWAGLIYFGLEGAFLHLNFFFSFLILPQILFFLLASLKSIKPRCNALVWGKRFLCYIGFKSALLH